MNIIDLTHTLTSNIPAYDLDCKFELKTLTDYKNCIAPNIFCTQQITMPGGFGTHIDAPAHCIPGARTIDKLEIGELVINCIVINVSNEANEHYKIPPSTVKQFESQHGKIEPNTFVIFYTGWDKHWNAPEKYRNNLLFPSIHEDTAKLLIERGIAGLGTDTLSADSGGKDFPVHRTVLGADKYLVENIANTQKLLPTGFKIFILPAKIKDATEAPVRLIALL